MSASADLQKAILGRLLADPVVSALVGDRVYDGPSASAIMPYVSFGPSDWIEDDDECIPGRIETIQLDVWGRDQGKKHPCRAIVDAVAAAIHGADLTLAGLAALHSIRVVRTQVFDDNDGVTAHGVVTVDALVELPD